MSAAAPEQTLLDVLLASFSRSVADVMTSLPVDQPTAWQIADGLLRVHPDYGGSRLSGISQSGGAVRPREQWLVLVRGMFDRGAIARTASEVIDGRLLLLALGRIDDGFERQLRTSGARWQLERELGFDVSTVLRPWALPAAPTQFLELRVAGHDAAVRDCAFSPDGGVLATVSDDGTARLWAVGSEGEDVAPTTFSERGRIRRCVFSPDGRLLAAVGDAGMEVWQVGAPDPQVVLESTVPMRTCAFSPDSSWLATGQEGGKITLWAVSGDQTTEASGHRADVRNCVFSPDGRLLATVGDDGTARLWDIPAFSEKVTLNGHRSAVWHCAFSPDGDLLATVDDSGVALVWEVASGATHPAWSTSDPQQAGHRAAIRSCAFSPDGTLLATASEDGTARLWDVESGLERCVLAHPSGGGVRRCAFNPDGSILATAGDDPSVHIWDVANGSVRARLDGHEGRLRQCAFSREGQLLATASDDGTARIWERIEAPSRLPAVSRDQGETDWLGVGPDAAALADLIAAKETSPPLSIGLFGDWGSGKSFLIGEVQKRIDSIARRARRSESSAYCGYVRNIVFNAWHYADANLWASLVTHIFDELAKPEPTAGVSDQKAAREQVARLQEELAASSALREQLLREQQRVRQVEARKRLALLTWRLGGAHDPGQSLGEIDAELTSIRGASRLLLPSTRARVVFAAVALLLAAIVVTIVAVLGAGQVVRILSSLGAIAATALVWIGAGSRYAARLLEQAGATAKVVDVQSTAIDAEVEAARAAEQRTATELADLKSGRRLARFVSERDRTDDYRAHLGLVSRIHDDFVQMSHILVRQQAAEAIADGETAPVRDGADGGSGLPRIDRIVLYIDDLDRCPPRRVVEILEAVHLILAVELFVVVIAVDPRWLLQSLKLHYSELLAGAPADPKPSKHVTTAETESDGSDLDPSTPVNYLEKIIQVPFALRPMAPRGVRSLVYGLLPVEVAATTADGALPGAALDASGGSVSSGSEAAPAANVSGRPAPAVAAAPMRAAAPSLSPRTLALTPGEREYAVSVAAQLRTPRTVKKFTNLYRLLRAGLDEHSGELDRFLVETGDAAEYRAVLILLALIIAYPEEASEILLSLGNLDPDAPADTRPWSEFLADVHSRGQHYAAVTQFLEQVTGAADVTAGWTREPFRRWALEVSRYSFATGQKVFSSTRERVPVGARNA